VLEEARRRGFLGPGPVEAHLDHADGFAEAVGSLWGSDGGSKQVADLGSGGGVPALSLAVRFVAWTWTLVESGTRRAGFLREAVQELGLADQVEVVEDRAEVVGRSPVHRARYDLVVARGFGPPAVVAECAAPLLCVEGRVVVSEPPGGNPARWPEEGLAPLGLRPLCALQAGGSSFQVLRQFALCPERFPRRVGMPSKRPLFEPGMHPQP
jgi:16S rRNA (guanine527-N7)-methyltransferase